MAVNFDQVIDHRAISNINKWKYYPPDVLPMWVADMDFRSPEPILAALRGALEHGILGYELPGEALLQTVANRMESLYAWKISPEMVIPVPGVGAGMVIALKALTNPGDGVLVQPPNFPPFLQLPALMGRVAQEATLKPDLRGGNRYYEPDLEAFNRAVENRSAVVITGVATVSGIINPDGSLVALETDPNGSRLTMVDDVALGPGGAPYTSLGDILGWVSLAGFIGFMVYQSRVERRAKKAAKSSQSSPEN